MKSLWPALLSLAVGLLFAGSRILAADGDPMALATLGTRFSRADPLGTEGYDGQFAYYIARDWSPAEVAVRLDAPAYRYQRILYPALARVLALGAEERVPWTLPLVNLAAHTLGTWAVAAILARQRLWTGYALAYGLWVGLIAPLGLDLNEPLAYGLAAGGLYLLQRHKTAEAGVCLSLALFAKETTVFFWIAAALYLLFSRNRAGVISLAVGGAAFALWQVWLTATFGEPGLASGGAGASGFEAVPFAGFLRIAAVDLKVFAVFLVVFGLSIVLPSIWGIVASGRALVKREVPLESLALLLNAGVLAFLPFSTYREPLGLVRFASGLVLGLVVFCAALRWKRPLNYALFWIAGLVLLIPR